MRRLLPTVFVVVLLVAGCGSDDEGDRTASSDSAGSVTSATSPTTATGGDDTLVPAADDEAFCVELEALADIDPQVAPTQDQVDLVTAAAEAAPEEYADDLTAVAAFGQMSADFSVSSTLPADLDAVQAAAVEAGTNLAAYASDTCGFDVPLFDTVAAA